mmetsp:Transcript_107812/g.344158  ORF Transcript_107812/g.344158 Transcript_107812/m.344158 type:complete len:213 (+) Transcript_107812:137-775(+)
MRHRGLVSRLCRATMSRRGQNRHHVRELIQLAPELLQLPSAVRAEQAPAGLLADGLHLVLEDLLHLPRDALQLARALGVDESSPRAAGDLLELLGLGLQLGAGVAHFLRQKLELSRALHLQEAPQGPHFGREFRGGVGLLGGHLARQALQLAGSLHVQQTPEGTLLQQLKVLSFSLHLGGEVAREAVQRRGPGAEVRADGDALEALHEHLQV